VDTPLDRPPFVACLELLLRHYSEKRWVLERADRRRLERCRDCILKHYCQPLPLQQLAGMSAMSRFEFARRFKQTFGVAPHAYQIHVRIEKARELLGRGASPASVAAEIGFADQSHFGRHFLRIVGVTPAQYAKGAGTTLHAIPRVRTTDTTATGPFGAGRDSRALRQLKSPFRRGARIGNRERRWP
jgi:AraC-like DNA-binding protein